MKFTKTSDAQYVQYKSTSNPLRAKQWLGMTLLAVALGTTGAVLMKRRGTTTVEQYCLFKSEIYSIGTKFKMDDGTYRECIQETPETYPYWAEIILPSSRPTPAI
jgi:hypothetical protein